jgi:arsenite methyltransferase
MTVRSSGRLPDDAVRTASIEKYRRRAAAYDSTCGPTMPIRERAIDLLDLQPGQTVLDVGCGTGLSLARLRERVGEAGHVYGFDQSPDMLEQARHRVVTAGWHNVMLSETSAQALVLPAPVDALLFHYTHDVLRSSSAVERLLAFARPGAAVAIAGIKYFPLWLAPLNIWVYYKNAGYNGAPGELRTPWDRIAPRLDGWRLSTTQFGMGYIASGRVRA